LEREKSFEVEAKNGRISEKVSTKKGGKESIRKRRQHNDIRYNGSQHNVLYLDIQH